MNCMNCKNYEPINNNTTNIKENTMRREDNTTTCNVTINGKEVKEMKTNATVDAIINGVKVELTMEVAQAFIGKKYAAESTKEVKEFKTWRDTSKFAGKELCGVEFDPYTFKRWVPAKFKKLVKEFGTDIHKAIRQTVSYKESVKHTAKMVHDMAKFKREGNAIAYNEGLYFWPLEDCKMILEKYINDLLTAANRRLGNMNESCCIRFGKGYNFEGVVTERIVNHEIVTMRKFIGDDYERLIKIKELIMRAYNYEELENAIRDMKFVNLYSEYKPVWRHGRYEYMYIIGGYSLSTVFVNNYKKVGSYYTIKSDIVNGEYFENSKGVTAMKKLEAHIAEAPYVLWAIYKSYAGISK